MNKDLYQLHHHCRSTASAIADTGSTALRALLFQDIQQSNNDAGSRIAERMP
jgi:dienelactone hydrolase